MEELKISADSYELFVVANNGQTKIHEIYNDVSSRRVVNIAKEIARGNHIIAKCSHTSISIFNGYGEQVYAGFLRDTDNKKVYNCIMY